jgi:hypothetical protein
MSSVTPPTPKPWLYSDQPTSPSSVVIFRNESVRQPPSAWKSSIDLLAIHQPKEFSEIWKSLEEKKNQPLWVIVENRSPDPKWCRFLEGLGYKLRFFFHDDEYYELQA